MITSKKTEIGVTNFDVPENRYICFQLVHIYYQL